MSKQTLINPRKVAALLTDVDTIIETESFGNAWWRALRHVKIHGKEIHFGGKFKDKDQYEKKTAMDVKLCIVLTGNALAEAIEGKLHPQFPTKEKVKEGYLEEWKRGYDWRKQGFTYCYEDRIEAYPGTRKVNGVMADNVPIKIDQWKLAREDLAQQIATGIQSNRNVIVIGNLSIDRFEIPDSPPCLRELWIRFEGFIDGIPCVSVHWRFRSRDLGSAWMTNIIGILSAVMREVIEPNGAVIIQVVDDNDSIHVYRGDWGLFDTVERVPVK